MLRFSLLLILGIVTLWTMFSSCFSSTAELSAAVLAPADEFTKQLRGEEKVLDMRQFERKELDIPYTTDMHNPRQTLDIIYPTNAKAPFKIIMLLHGGAWAMTNKRSESIASIYEAINQGYAIVAVNYRLSNEVKWPYPLYDIKAAVRFIRANAKHYELDASKIVLWGVSSGGHLAQMMAATNGNTKFEDLSMGNAKTSSEVQGIVSWYGISDISRLSDIGTNPANILMGYNVRLNANKTKEANPIAWVNKKFPPILLVHGSEDGIVPIEQAIDMQNKVNQITKKHHALLEILDGGIHGDSIIKSKDNVLSNLFFVDKILYPKGENPYRSHRTLTIKLKE